MTFEENSHPRRVITRSKKISSFVWLFISTCFMVVMLTSAVNYTLKMQKGENSIDNDPCPAVNFDYFLLATIWTPTGCITNGCADDYIQQWTVHGLWPNYNNGSWPQNCCAKDPFDENKLAPIRSELDKYWPTFLKGETSPQFWAHEWSKHGTCSYKNKKVDGELKYFNGTLSLFKEHSIPDALSKAQIVPGTNIYSKSEIKEAIINSFGKTPALACVHPPSNNVNQVQLLDSVQLCVDKTSLELIDCTHLKDPCPDQIQIPTKGQFNN